ncbi:MAG TPA: ABC transporter ATP-binding protein [Aestuariivirgaceae bacterium]|jgi:ABC-2 type transport system ATP-binding protein
MSVASVQGLVKRFGDKIAVNGVSLTLEKGEIMGFLGPNGSGKTTTIRMICGLLTPDAGSGTVLGRNVLTESQEIKREVGYMTQRFTYYEDLTIAENLAFVAKLYDLTPVAKHVSGVLDELGLSDRKNQLVGTLSGGWKQRLALAASLMHKPKLLLLDEPTAGVDPKARRLFWDELHRRAADGLTVLVSTHYMDEAERCHRLTYISNGVLLMTGTTDEIVARSGLVVYVVEGPGLATIASELEEREGVDQVASFGATLHVVGRDSAALKNALDAATKGKSVRVKTGDTSLEDVLIDLMGQAGGTAS